MTAVWIATYATEDDIDAALDDAKPRTMLDLLTEPAVCVCASREVAVAALYAMHQDAIDPENTGEPSPQLTLEGDDGGGFYWQGKDGVFAHGRVWQQDLRE
jgi:hypothetical protein